MNIFIMNLALNSVVGIRAASKLESTETDRRASRAQISLWAKNMNIFIMNLALNSVVGRTTKRLPILHQMGDFLSLTLTTKKCSVVSTQGCSLPAM